MRGRRRPLRVGLVGCGYACERLHLPAMARLSDVRAVAVADLDPGRLDSVGRRFGIDRRYRDHEALLRDPEVDAVAVCVPPAAHAALALAALDAGKHVFVEKPLCLDLADADRLVERARVSASTAMVGFNLRYHRHVRAARGAVAQGLIGPVELIRSVWSSRSAEHAGLPHWRRHGDLGGGVLSDLAVHHVDLWRFVVGSEVDDVFAARRGATDDGGQTATVSGRLRSGALAVSAFSECAAEAHEIEVLGRGGQVSISPYRFDGFAVSAAASFAGDLGRRVGGLVRAVRALPGAVASAVGRGAFLASYRAMWRHFAAAARAGAPTDSTFEDGRRALEVVLAAGESLRAGRAMSVRRREPGGPIGCGG